MRLHQASHGVLYGNGQRLDSMLIVVALPLPKEGAKVSMHQHEVLFGQIVPVHFHGVFAGQIGIKRFPEFRGHGYGVTPIEVVVGFALLAVAESEASPSSAIGTMLGRLAVCRRFGKSHSSSSRC